MAAVVVATAGCGGGDGSHPSARRGSTTTRPPAPGTTTPPPTTAPPAPPLRWAPCGSLQCATLEVPLDYSRPDDVRIGLAVARRPALDPARRIGSLVINPGGPGDSGVDDLPTELRVLGPEVQDRFDVVSYDPRGVARSDPVRCGGAGPTTALLPDPAPGDAAGRQQLVADDRAFAAACLSGSGAALLAHAGTREGVEDLDRLRAALGDDRLTFVGHSYGTYLGALYADAYPGRVRAAVLDGALDPALDLTRQVEAQAVGFDRVLGQFLSWCGADPGPCGWRPGSDPGAAFRSLLDTARRHPLPAGPGRQMGPGEIYEAVEGVMYSPSRWPALGQALGAAAGGNGAPVVALSDAYLNHGGPNGADAFEAVTCVDHPVPGDPAAYPALARELSGPAPVFGPVFAWGELACGLWPVPPTGRPHPVTAAGSPPILVVGTTADPVTPAAWAQSLAAELQHGVLLMRQGRDHVAYFYSACVRSWVDRYLVAGATPPAGTVCAS
ncbi:MAG TPA: alpha/beta hydrolase [Acidimicrobiales bacterium]|nr:alpha/beta hydrolase [Acidimicrobiales bacterium]